MKSWMFIVVLLVAGCQTTGTKQTLSVRAETTGQADNLAKAPVKIVAELVISQQ